MTISILVTILSFLFVLGVLVFVHELGHYWVARRNDIEVEEFGLGYPPRAIKLFRYDGTEFTLNWIPFGGFARMRGEDASDMSRGSFNAAGRWARASTLFAGPFMNLALAAVLFAVSFMFGGSETLAAHAMLKNADSEIAARLGLQAGDILLEAGGKPVLINAEPQPAQLWKAGRTQPVDLIVVRDRQRTQLPPVNSADLQALLASADVQPVLGTRIEATTEGSPAALAGLKPGDLIYAVNDTVITLQTPLNQIVQQNLGKQIGLTVLRQDKLVEIRLTPRLKPPKDEGAMGVQIGLMVEFATLPFLHSIWQGLLTTLQYVVLVLQLPIMLVLGDIAPSAAQVSGPVGIAREVGGAVNYTLNSGVFWPIWRLSAALSAALAITNLLPLPALDGGRLLFIIIETIRGRRVNPEREGLVHMVGFMLLLGLMVMITIRDIASPQATIDWSQLIGQ